MAAREGESCEVQRVKVMKKSIIVQTLKPVRERGNLEPPCSRLSYAVIRASRIARIEGLVPSGTGVPARSSGYPTLGRVGASH